MKKILLSGIFILLFTHGYSQKLTGTVFDKLTGFAVQGATVFLNGSTIRNRTDRIGDFSLFLPENQRLPVVAAYPDHEILLLLEYPGKAHVHFYLNPRIYAMGDPISFKEDRKSRGEYLAIFRKQFLGNSVNGAKCKIVNESDLIFRYDPRTAMLKARSKKPLTIINGSLGYRITYYLTKFEFNSKADSVSYSGCWLFSDDPSLTRDEFESAEKKRKLAYFGSWMEFFRALWSNALDSAGYDLRNESNKKLTYDSLVLEINGSKYWKYNKPVTIYHFTKNQSTTIQTGETVYFDKLGYHDTEGVGWRKTGEMTYRRLGDQLPFDYKVTQERPDVPVP